jgi:hypothetical protein
VGQNQVVLRHRIILFPMNLGVCERGNKRSGARQLSEQCGASKWVSGASERANRRTYVSIHGCFEPQCSAVQANEWAVHASKQMNGRASGPILQSVFLAVLDHSTVVWNKQESRRKYWATRSSVRSFARTAHSFACSGLLASLAPSAALTRSLARSLRSLPRSWDSELLDGYLICVFSRVHATL